MPQEQEHQGVGGGLRGLGGLEGLAGQRLGGRQLQRVIATFIAY